MSTISSGINIKKFDDFTKQTTELYVQKYKRYNMSPTVYKVLYHVAFVVQNLLLPIGQLTENAQVLRCVLKKNRSVLR